MSVAEFFENSAVRCALLLAVLAVLVAASYWGLRKFRSYIDDDQTPVGELLTNYRELHEEGVLSDAEYRTIKSRLNAGMRRESGSTDRAG
jgi:hypothetical protein